MRALKLAQTSPEYLSNHDLGQPRAPRPFPKISDIEEIIEIFTKGKRHFWYLFASCQPSWTPVEPKLLRTHLVVQSGRSHAIPARFGSKLTKNLELFKKNDDFCQRLISTCYKLRDSPLLYGLDRLSLAPNPTYRPPRFQRHHF